MVEDVEYALSARSIASGKRSAFFRRVDQSIKHLQAAQGKQKISSLTRESLDALSLPRRKEGGNAQAYHPSVTETSYETLDTH